MKQRNNILLACAIAAIAVSIAILSCVPPTSRDALSHHLAVPKIYIQKGGICEIPYIPFSYYPMNLDILYMIPLYFGNDILPKFVHFSFALLTAALIFIYLRKRLDGTYALAGVLMFLSIPVIVKLSISVYVDLGVAFFSFASVYFLLKWMESFSAGSTGQKKELRYLILSGVFCGLSLGTKYNGLIVLFLLTLFTVFLLSGKTRNAESKNRPPEKRKAGRLKALGAGLIFTLAALAVFSPWMIRNTLWTGNPIYPLFDSLFNRAVEEKTDDDSDKGFYSHKSNPLMVRRVIFKESWPQIMLLPARIFFEGRDDSYRHFDGVLNPYLLLLPFFAFIGNRRENPAIRTEKKILLAFSVLFTLFAFSFTIIRIRYIVPILPPLAILSVFGIHGAVSFLSERYEGAVGSIAKGAFFAVLFLLVGLNAFYLAKQFVKVEPLDYISGKIGRDEYISKRRPGYPVFLHANRTLPEDARILGVFLSHRGYYSDRETIFDDNLFPGIFKRVKSPEAVRAALKKRSFSHLLIRFDQFGNWANRSNLDEKEKSNLSDFFKIHTRELISSGGYGLYELK